MPTPIESAELPHRPLRSFLVITGCVLVIAVGALIAVAPGPVLAAVAVGVVLVALVVAGAQSLRAMGAPKD